LGGTAVVAATATRWGRCWSWWSRCCWLDDDWLVLSRLGDNCWSGGVWGGVKTESINLLRVSEEESNDK